LNPFPPILGQSFFYSKNLLASSASSETSAQEAFGRLFFFFLLTNIAVQTWNAFWKQPFQAFAFAR